MRSIFAAVLAALAIAGGVSRPAEVSAAGANPRDIGPVNASHVRFGYQAAERPRLHLARATVNEGGAKPTDRTRADGVLELRRFANQGRVRSARRSGNRANRYALRHRQVARRSVHRTVRQAARPARPAVVARPVETGSPGLTGVASYYWQGQKTATGERFNPEGLTAAHRTLPFGTRVRVTHLANGRTVDVRINDRGPFIAGRIIDLSRGAAGVIGMHGQGLARVKVTVLDR